MRFVAMVDVRISKMQAEVYCHGCFLLEVTIKHFVLWKVATPSAGVWPTTFLDWFPAYWSSRSPNMQRRRGWNWSATLCRAEVCDVGATEVHKILAPASVAGDETNWAGLILFARGSRPRRHSSRRFLDEPTVLSESACEIFLLSLFF